MGFYFNKKYKYLFLDSDHPVPSSENSVIAVLQVNIQACGYPPKVTCDHWYNVSAGNDTTIPCHYSRTNSSLAITELDPEAIHRDLLMTVLVPILICVISSLIVYVLNFSNKCRKCCQNSKNKEYVYSHFNRNFVT